MAETPHPAQHSRPLSPFTTIYRWTPTMASSITHRVTGVGLSLGLIVLVWWLVATANGPETFNGFAFLLSTPLGQIVLFGLSWALCFHLLNGVRHLAWDLGYGFNPKAANQWSIAIYILSIAVPIALFGAAYGGFGGYYQ